MTFFTKLRGLKICITEPWLEKGQGREKALDNQIFIITTKGYEDRGFWIRRFRSFLIFQFKLWHVREIMYSSENTVCISEDAYVIKNNTSLSFTILFLDLFFFIANVQLFHSLFPLTKMDAPWRQRPLLPLFTADPRILLLHHRWSAHFCQGMNLLCPRFRVTVRIR